MSDALADLKKELDVLNRKIEKWFTDADLERKKELDRKIAALEANKKKNK